ncbi:hypothetical protein LTR85_010713 [Meristemomyces frigidus]|nr:hypothetical protein LTR85_010713 [Meristemomyces frigidus]
MAVPLVPLEDHASVFRYEALESPSTFRLLKLQPGGQGDKITASLHHYVLEPESCPPYRAISYTWGRDTARHSIHLPGDAVIKVRKNLRNALLSVRDKEAECLLWIDAICIDQGSDEERNHQVRLMADIYGMANIVLVWLQSADESADVARAFKFIHAAATFDTTNQSGFHYSRAHPAENKSNWRSVKNLCKPRYWTRKWIIQALVMARTAVLHVGNSECSMTDLEAFCSELHRERNNDAYKKFGSARRDYCKVINGSPAARLALQRLDRSNEQQPLLLHDLIERYAKSECERPEDHLYALYTLVGQHRMHLSINYAATPVQRLVAVLRFVYTYDQLPPSKVVEFVNLLVQLFGIKQEDVLQEQGLSEDFNVVVPSTILGTVELQPEFKGWRALRRRVERLDPMACYVLDTWHEVRVLMASEGLNNPQEPVAQQDMTYFTIEDSGFHGLAACRLEAGDVISHFPATQLVFAVREMPGQRALILGRAYLFSPAQDSDKFDFWLREPFDYNTVRRGEQRVSVHRSKLIELGSLACLSKDVWKDPNERPEIISLNDGVIVGSAVIFILMLAVILVQVTRG